MEQGESEYFPHVESANTSKQCLIFRNRFTLPIELEELIMKYLQNNKTGHYEVLIGTICNKEKNCNIEEINPRFFGIYKYNQMPDFYTIVGLALIISGVLIVNLIGKTT